MMINECVYTRTMTYTVYSESESEVHGKMWTFDTIELVNDFIKSKRCEWDLYTIQIWQNIPNDKSVLCLAIDVYNDDVAISTPEFQEIARYINSL